MSHGVVAKSIFTSRSHASHATGWS